MTTKSFTITILEVSQEQGLILDRTVTLAHYGQADPIQGQGFGLILL